MAPTASNNSVADTQAWNALDYPLTVAEIARLSSWRTAFAHLRETIDWPSPRDARRLQFAQWLYRAGRISG